MKTKSIDQELAAVQRRRLTEDTSGIFEKKQGKENTGHLTEKGGKQEARTKGVKATDQRTRVRKTT